jgi:hypothetical protein
MPNFDYKTLPGHLGEFVEFRDNSEYPELKDLWWPRIRLGVLELHAQALRM